VKEHEHDERGDPRAKVGGDGERREERVQSPDNDEGDNNHHQYRDGEEHGKGRLFLLGRQCFGHFCFYSTADIFFLILKKNKWMDTN